jgi:hypothetical protein
MMPESMVGRAVLNAAATVLYAISDSGVMVLPVGSLNQAHRLAPAQEDVLVETNFCNRTPASQSLTIADPGGGHTDFSIAASQAGVTIVPAFGTTPATVQVLVDTARFPALGTTAVTLRIGRQHYPNHTAAGEQPRREPARLDCGRSRRAHRYSSRRRP